MPFLSLLNELYFGSRSPEKDCFKVTWCIILIYQFLLTFSCNFYEMWNIAWLNTCMTHRQKRLPHFLGYILQNETVVSVNIFFKEFQMSNWRITSKLLIWLYAVTFYLTGSVRLIFFVKAVFAGIVKEFIHSLTLYYSFNSYMKQNVKALIFEWCFCLKCFLI